MKKTLCLLLSFIMLFSSVFAFNISAYAENNEITVYDFGDTNGNVPSYSIYKHSKSQYIISADALSSIAGQSIISIKWYMKSHKIIRNIEVYLSECENVSLRDCFIEVAEKNKVFDGEWAYDENKNEVSVDFASPYKYFGSDLLITVIDKTGSWSMGNSFFGDGSAGSSVEAHSEIISYTSDDASGGTSVNFVPKTTIVSDGELFHVHSMTPTEKKAATCTERGKEAYYFCEGCGGYFEDIDGEKEITDISSWGVTEALGHSFGEWVVTKAATCISRGEEKRVCINDNSHSETRALPKTAHKTKKIPAKEATTSAAGNTEYYECTVCHKYFKDSSAKTEITDKASVVIPKVIVDKKLNIEAGSVKTAINIDKKTMTVSWKAVKGAANYELQYRKQGASKWTSKTTGGKASYLIKSLSKGGLYEFRIRSISLKGKQKTLSQFSAVNYRYISKANPPKLTAGKGSFTASWTKDKNASSYEIQYSTDSSFKKDVKKLTASSNTTKKTVKNLKKGKKYYVRILSIKKKNNKNYLSDFSDKKLVTTKK